MDDTTIFPSTKEERQEAFLAFIAENAGTDGNAAQAVGLTHWAIILWKRDPEFKKRYLEARKISIEHLVKEAERRAMNGSDRLLEFLLCNYAPEKFTKREKVEHSGNMSLQVVTGLPADDGSDLV